MSPEKIESHQLIIDTLKIAETRPITVSEISAILPLMRQELLDAGIKLELSETALDSLRQKQFRNLTDGRGTGMLEAMGDESRANALLLWCQEKCVGGSRIGGKDGTEGRGLRQLAADTILLLANPEPTLDEIENFTLRLNRRVKKGLIKSSKGEEAKESIRQSFTSVPDIADTNKWREFASVPKGSVADLYEFLTTPATS